VGEVVPVALEQHESQWLIRLEGQVTLASAAELKKLLLECLPAGKGLKLDLDRADEIDITVLQLLWAVAREAKGAGAGIECHASSAAAATVCDSGFAQIPGFPVPVSHE
jgi:ABC-type transporter Mla MlaB component